MVEIAVGLFVGDIVDGALVGGAVGCVLLVAGDVVAGAEVVGLGLLFFP